MKTFVFTACVCMIVTCSYAINSTRETECRIVKMISNKGDTLNIVYDATGRVQTITEMNGHVTSFNYCDNTIIAIETNRGVISYKRIMTLGCNGMMSNLYEEKFFVGFSNWVYRSYTFSGTELTGITTIFSSGTTPIQATFKWSNGNFISESSGDVKQGLYSVNQYEYYEDKPVQPGDYWQINLLSTLGIGNGLYQNKNLLKSIRSGNSITQISYEFDKDGKIISMTKTNGADQKIWYYHYGC